MAKSNKRLVYSPSFYRSQVQTLLGLADALRDAGFAELAGRAAHLSRQAEWLATLTHSGAEASDLACLHFDFLKGSAALTRAAEGNKAPIKKAPLDTEGMTQAEAANAKHRYAVQTNKARAFAERAAFFAAHPRAFQGLGRGVRRGTA